MQLPGVFSTKYQQDMAIVRTKTHWFLIVVALVFIFTLPKHPYMDTEWLQWLVTLCVWIIAVLGLHILTGLTGLLSMGQAAFIAVGAYAAGILTMNYGWSPWATLPCSGIIAGLVGLVFGVPALRIKGFYFAMATLAASFIILWLIEFYGDWTGGGMGMTVDYLSVGGTSFREDDNLVYIALPLAILMILIAVNIQRTRVGRALIAIRDNDLAAEVMGVNLFRYKVLALFLCSFFAGIAGWLWAYDWQRISPDYFTFDISIWMVGILVVGGMGSTAGAVMGTIALRLTQKLADEIPGIVEKMESVNYVSPEVIVPLVLPVVILGVLLWRGIKVLEYKKLLIAFVIVYYGIAAALLYFGDHGMSSTLKNRLGDIVFAIVIAVFMIFQPRGLYYLWLKFKANYRLFPYSD